jgi:DNA-binding MarR family transcriptional regulator
VSSRQPDELVARERRRAAALGPLTKLFVAWTQRRFQEGAIETALARTDDRAMNVVYILAVQGARSPGQLADDLGTGRSNTSKILARLVEAGLVVRTSDPNDGRGARICLTDAGRDLADRLLAFVDRMMAELIADWPDRRVDRFAADLSEFADRALDAALRLGGGPTTSDAPGGATR